ncbi:MAG: FliA/WhiG family RNA polymerase sigma factor [Rubricoccaceae bacterium]
MSEPSLQSLVERYLADPTPVRREAAILGGVPLVRSLIGKIRVPDHPLASTEDLESAGLIGLVEALNGYDADNGAAFMTYAYLRVRGSIIDYLRSLDVLSLDKRKRMAEAGAVAETLRQELGTEPSDRDVAERMGLDLGAYDQLMMEAQARFALSLDAPAGPDADGGSMYELVPDDAAARTSASTEHSHTMTLVRSAIETLPERTRAMLGMYYDDELTLREIGQVFQVSEARVSQILGKTMIQIRASLEGEPVA